MYLFDFPIYFFDFLLKFIGAKNLNLKIKNLDITSNHIKDDKFNLNKVQKILDRDHFGLEKVKERIIEYLSVLKLKGDMKSPILCLYGPPGVGKTSLGKSIAEAIGRKYVRMSLGGLHDESEIRGHRKTYIGAMPGKVINNLKKCGSSNPVFVLDEIDKVGRSGHGDPSSALLEVLDPEQNDSFQDNLLSPPVYTRPRDFRGHKVPDVLLSGNFKLIEAYREDEAYKRTKERRPDLLGE